jgi:hypothetical protein
VIAQLVYAVTLDEGFRVVLSLFLGGLFCLAWPWKYPLAHDDPGGEGCGTCEDTTTGEFDLFGVDLGFGGQTVGDILRRFSAVLILIYVHGHDFLLGLAYAE